MAASNTAVPRNMGRLGYFRSAELYSPVDCTRRCAMHGLLAAAASAAQARHKESKTADIIPLAALFHEVSMASRAALPTPRLFGYGFAAEVRRRSRKSTGPVFNGTAAMAKERLRVLLFASLGQSLSPNVAATSAGFTLHSRLVRNRRRQRIFSRASRMRRKRGEIGPAQVMILLSCEMIYVHLGRVIPMPHAQALLAGLLGTICSKVCRFR